MAARSRLSLAEQAFALRSAFPEGCGRIAKGKRLIFDLPLQPTAASRSYAVRIEYVQGHQPRVRVLDPPLRPRPGSSEIPHTYSPDTVCLHLPEEWNSGMRLADTIVPWASEWFFHYELWLASGQWLGGGHT